MRDSKLYEIETALKERGIPAKIESVKDLRSMFPKLPQDLRRIEDLDSLKELIPTANLEDWGYVPPKQKEPKTDSLYWHSIF